MPIRLVAKSEVAPMSECAFLGFTIKGKKIRWTDKALANIKHRIKELTGRVDQTMHPHVLVETVALGAPPKIKNLRALG